MEVDVKQAEPKKTRIPYRSISFMAQSGKHAMKLGVRKGVSKAATKVSPPLIVIDAVISVVDCISSFIELAKARTVRDGLRREVGMLTEKLAVQRDKLRDDLDVAKRQLDKRAEQKEIIAELVKECQLLFSESMKAFHILRTADLPNLGELNELEDEVIERWRALKHTLELYQQA